MAETKTTISNMALDRIAVKTISDFDSDTGNPAVKVRIHYDQTRKAVLESFPWAFAGSRKTLTEPADSPAFGWDNQFSLPQDYLIFRRDDSIDGSLAINDRWEIEGEFVYSNDASIQLVYTVDFEDPDKFDSLFIEVLVLTLAIKLLYPLAGTSPITIGLHDELKKDLAKVTSKARRIHKKANNVSGRSDWNVARSTRGTVFTRQGRVFG